MSRRCCRLRLRFSTSTRGTERKGSIFATWRICSVSNRVLEPGRGDHSSPLRLAIPADGRLGEHPRLRISHLRLQVGRVRQAARPGRRRGGHPRAGSPRTGRPRTGHPLRVTRRRRPTRHPAGLLTRASSDRHQGCGATSCRHLRHVCGQLFLRSRHLPALPRARPSPVTGPLSHLPRKDQMGTKLGCDASLNCAEREGFEPSDPG